MPEPRFPIYIPSKSRSDTALTPRFLDLINVPYRLVVEESQYESYAECFPTEKLLVLDPQYQADYDTFDDLGDTKSKGAGPARNFIWDHSIAEGHDWHWVMDDNIRLFARLHKNQRIPVGDGTMFHAMEDFCLRYTNVGMAGPHYWMFAPSRVQRPPYLTGTRVYSCNLIRNDLPLRWRGRYNEDTDLSLRLLKSGWTTVQFNAFLQYKVTTQTVKGGNTEAFYAEEGTLPKSQMLVDMHPDVTRLVQRWGRWHHYVDYRRWKDLGLVKDPSYKPPDVNPYKLKMIDEQIAIPSAYRPRKQSEAITLRHHIFIPSKGRATTCKTADALRELDYSAYTIVVEPQDFAAYSETYPPENLLELMKNDQGIAYARQTIKEYSKGKGHPYHWQIDDDLTFLKRIDDKNVRHDVLDLLNEVETTVDGYTNIGLAGLNDQTWAFNQKTEIGINKQICGCFLINNATQADYRPNVIEDTDFNLQILTEGLCTLRFNRLLYKNPPPINGGNSGDTHYDRITTLQQNLQKLWPDVFQLRYRDDGTTRLKPSRIWQTFGQVPQPK